jgi:hypothetical protein
MRREIFRSPRITLSQLEARVRQRPGELCLLEQRTCCRQKHANLAVPDALQRLNSLAGNFSVRLGFPESFARRVKRDESGITE